MTAPRLSADSLRGVSETLLLPLCACAEARERFPELGFQDPWAEERLARLEVDRSRYNRRRSLMRGGVLRAMAFDRWVEDFFERHPQALGVEPGAGLSARFQRIDNGRLRWVDLDLPPVIALKRQLVQETPRYSLQEGSVTELSWIPEMVSRAGGPLLVVIEGVLPYLLPEQVRALLGELGRALPAGSELLFDYAHPWITRDTRSLPEVHRTGARFAWGSREIHEVEAWAPRLRLMGQQDLLAPVGAWARLGSRIFRLLSGAPAYGLARFRV